MKERYLGSSSNSSNAAINPDMLVSAMPKSDNASVASSKAQVVGGSASVTIADTQATSRYVIDPKMLAPVTQIPSNNAKVDQGENAHVTAGTTHDIFRDTQIASCHSLTSSPFKSQYLVDPNMLFPVTVLPSNNAQVVQGDNAHVSKMLVPPFWGNSDTLVTSKNVQVARKNTFCTSDNTRVASCDALMLTNSYSTGYVINPKMLLNVAEALRECAQVVKGDNTLVTANASHVTVGAQVVVGNPFGSTPYSTNSMINPNMLVPILSENIDTVVASENIAKVATNILVPSLSENIDIVVTSENIAKVATTGNTEVAMSDDVTVTGEFESLDLDMEDLDLDLDMEDLDLFF